MGGCPLGSPECELVIGDDGCAECICDDNPIGCGEIDDYCGCANEPGCAPVTNGIDCGYGCECIPDMICTCWGTELLACQPDHCPPGLGERCDLEDGRCELLLDDRGCAYCSCPESGDACSGLAYCDCFLNEECEVVADECICTCDWQTQAIVAAGCTRAVDVVTATLLAIKAGNSDAIDA